MDSENSLSGKLLLDFTYPIASSHFNTIVRIFNISNCSTCAGINSTQAEITITWYEINTVEHLNQKLVVEEMYACTF